MGVTWHGDYSAESLLRDRFHELADHEVEALARFAGGTGGVLMTSDTLDALPPVRAELFAALLRERADGCDFLLLGEDGAVVEQRVRRDGETIAVNLFNPTDAAAVTLDGCPIPAYTLVAR